MLCTASPAWTRVAHSAERSVILRFPAPQVVSEKQPTAEQLTDLRFAWRCVKHVKSNAITIAKAGRLLGMGSGQPNRVKSTQIAMEKAGAWGWRAIVLLCTGFVAQ